MDRTLDRAAALAAFDRQLRRDLPPGEPGTTVERTPALTRHVANGPTGWSGVVWSDLAAVDADRVIAEEVARFRAAPGHHEWKHYHHDRPADLGERLAAAGLAAGPDEAVMVAEAAAVAASAPPVGVALVEVVDEAGIAAAVAVHAAAFGGDFGWLGERMRAVLASAPDRLDVVLAMAGGIAVGAARTEYHPGAEFASLWGGGTRPAYRGRGIYRALVAHRARRARDRGVRYLQVDALPTSRPILERVGFSRIATTTPYALG